MLDAHGHSTSTSFTSAMQIRFPASRNHPSLPSKPEQSDAGDPLGCVVVGSILFNVLNVCGVPLPSRLILAVLRLPFRASLALSHATVVRKPEHAGSRSEAGGQVGANGSAVPVAEQVCGIEVKALVPRHGRTWFMAGFMSSGFACCRAGFMAGFMASKKPRFDRAKMQSCFPCNLPRALAFLAQVEDVLFEDGGMGFHREQ